jgi:acetyl esterase/lipase
MDTPTNQEMPTPGEWQRHIRYGKDNVLQDYDVFLPAKQGHPQRSSPWIIYIHGGFFRDPLVLADSFHATVDLIQASEHGKHIAGYATLNYRLSKHVNHAQPPDTPEYDLRNASWPQHLDDVLSGIKQLQSTYKFGSDYILAGHSVGAQLALLVALKAQEHGFPAPAFVLGLSGIYDFPLIHKDFPAYKALTFNAMKEGEEVAASPVNYKVEDYKRAGVQHVMLGHSKDDGLVPWNQVDAMVEVLEKSAKGKDFVSVVELHGAHNDIWRDGKESSRAIIAALQRMATT